METAVQTPGIGARVVVVNRLFGTEPVVIHAHGPLHHKPTWPRIREAVLAHPRYVGPVPKLTVLTCNNGNGEMGLLESSAAALGIPCKVTGQGFHPWVHAIHKPRAALDGVREIETEYTLYADSRDAIVLSDLPSAVERFERMDGCDMLFGGDRINWPGLERYRKFEARLPGARQSEFRYLNAGVWMGRTSFLREFFAEALETPPPSEADFCDQGIMKDLLQRHYPRVQIDTRCEIFQNIGFIFTDIFDVNVEEVPS
jgi:hypothetical protein